MTNSNRIKLTWISFLSYALTGALVIVTGMVMGNIADYFNLPVSSMSNTFTFLNAGILISIFLNAWLMEIVPLKTQLRFGFLLMVLAGDLHFFDNRAPFFEKPRSSSGQLHITVPSFKERHRQPLFQLTHGIADR
eukprot:162175_1